MLIEKKEIPMILKFCGAVGFLEVFFNSSWPIWIGIPRPMLVPLFGFLLIVTILWIIYGDRRDQMQSEEPAE